MRTQSHTAGVVRAGITGIILLASLLAAGCAGGKMDADMITVTLDKPAEDTATVSTADGRAVIDVTSPSGIGGLTATLGKGEWPGEVIVRLRLRGLERLEFGYSNFLLSTGVSSTGDPNPPLMLTVVDEEGNVERASPSANIYYPTIRFVDGGGQALATPAFPLPEGTVIEVVMPPHFHEQEQTSFWMQWIDFYR